MNIAVASGKGGTGKTTIAVSLGKFCSEKGISVSVFDCDVEAPNVNLFLKAHVEHTEKVYRLIPEINDEACTGCGECESICAYSAIVLIKGRPLVLPDMCHSCGGCYHVCPEKAVTEIKKELGTIELGRIGTMHYAGGLLNIGEPMSPPLIKETKRAHHTGNIRIFDCPPGTSCPVVESVRESDFLILVTEPTPFGLNDLKLAADMARALRIRFGVVINKSGKDDGLIETYCVNENIPIISRLPFEKEIAIGYSRGEIIRYLIERHSHVFENIYSHILGVLEGVKN